MRGSKQRIAILGGGPASLTTAFWLSSTPELRERFEIDVYQMGFRLGGKCASGRGEDGRIEEHGLHVLFGFYQNFFSMMRLCYAELERSPDDALATWKHAFMPHDFGAATDYFDGVWHVWPFLFPCNGQEPGAGEALLRSRDYLGMLVQFMAGRLLGWSAADRLARGLFPRGPAWMDSEHPGDGLSDGAHVRLVAQLAQRLLAALSGELDRRPNRLVLHLVRRLHRVLHALVDRRADLSIDEYRLWLGWDYVLTVFRGIIDDGVMLPGGLHAIDRYDYREWLKRHGAHARTLASSYAQLIYDAAFSYRGGNPDTQQIAAGAALRALMRLVGTYKGAVYYKMQAGMGEAVITPLYEVLRRRGVRFHFFHEVRSLRLSSDRRLVERVQLRVQAETLAAPYSPLIEVSGMQCWRTSPDYSQLRDGDALRDVNLESYYPTRDVGHERVLEAGRDFDQLVFGIPIGAVPFLCKELLAVSPRWRTMVEHVQSVATMSCQLWFDPPLDALGWRMPNPLLSLYAPPLNTWSDMSHLLPTEAWPKPGPASAAYFTGPQPGPRYAPPPGVEGRAFERSQHAEASQAADELLAHGLRPLLPDVPADACVRARYVRSNCGPSDRCTIALPGATQHRMRAGDTGFDNLVITGDWIDNGIYVACMEGTVQAGMLAARAVSGEPFPIIGEQLNGMRVR